MLRRCCSSAKFSVPISNNNHCTVFTTTTTAAVVASCASPATSARARHFSLCHFRLHHLQQKQQQQKHLQQQQQQYQHAPFSSSSTTSLLPVPLGGIAVARSRRSPKVLMMKTATPTRYMATAGPSRSKDQDRSHSDDKALASDDRAAGPIESEDHQYNQRTTDQEVDSEEQGREAITEEQEEEGGYEGEEEGGGGEEEYEGDYEGGGEEYEEGEYDDEEGAEGIDEDHQPEIDWENVTEDQMQDLIGTVDMFTNKMADFKQELDETHKKMSLHSERFASATYTFPIKDYAAHTIELNRIRRAQLRQRIKPPPKVTLPFIKNKDGDSNTTTTTTTTTKDDNHSHHNNQEQQQPPLPTEQDVAAALEYLIFSKGALDKDQKQVIDDVITNLRAKGHNAEADALQKKSLDNVDSVRDHMEGLLFRHQMGELQAMKARHEAARIAPDRDETKSNFAKEFDESNQLVARTLELLQRVDMEHGAQHIMMKSSKQQQQQGQQQQGQQQQGQQQQGQQQQGQQIAKPSSKVDDLENEAEDYKLVSQEEEEQLKQFLIREGLQHEAGHAHSFSKPSKAMQRRMDAESLGSRRRKLGHEFCQLVSQLINVHLGTVSTNQLYDRVLFHALKQEPHLSDSEAVARIWSQTRTAAIKVLRVGVEEQKLIAAEHVDSPYRRAVSPQLIDLCGVIAQSKSTDDLFSMTPDELTKLVDNAKTEILEEERYFSRGGAEDSYMREQLDEIKAASDLMGPRRKRFYYVTDARVERLVNHVLPPGFGPEFHAWLNLIPELNARIDRVQHKRRQVGQFLRDNAKQLHLSDDPFVAIDPASSVPSLIDPEIVELLTSRLRSMPAISAMITSMKHPDLHALVSAVGETTFMEEILHSFSTIFEKRKGKLSCASQLAALLETLIVQVKHSGSVNFEMTNRRSKQEQFVDNVTSGFLNTISEKPASVEMHNDPQYREVRKQIYANICGTSEFEDISSRLLDSQLAVIRLMLMPETRAHLEEWSKSTDITARQFALLCEYIRNRYTLTLQNVVNEATNRRIATQQETLTSASTMATRYLDMMTELEHVVHTPPSQLVKDLDEWATRAPYISITTYIEPSLIHDKGAPGSNKVKLTTNVLNFDLSKDALRRLYAICGCRIKGSTLKLTSALYPTREENTIYVKKLFQQLLDEAKKADISDEYKIPNKPQPPQRSPIQAISDDYRNQEEEDEQAMENLKKWTEMRAQGRNYVGAQHLYKLWPTRQQTKTKVEEVQKKATDSLGYDITGMDVEDIDELQPPEDSPAADLQRQLRGLIIEEEEEEGAGEDVDFGQVDEEDAQPPPPPPPHSSSKKPNK